MVGGFMAAGTSQLFMGIMLKPMTEELGWSRTATSGAITLGTLFAGLLSPGTGWLADRFGPRLLAPLGALGVVAAYFLLSQTTELWHFYVAYVFGRGLSASTLGGVVPMTMAANWFRRYRGRAMGMVSMAAPLGGAVLALTGQLIIDSHGWRTVFTVFGIILLLLYVVPALLVFRRRPEDIGLLPDGREVMDSSTTTVQVIEPEVSWTFSQAVHTRTFWLLVGGLWFGILGNGAVSFHLAAYYSDQGLSTTTAATSLALYGFMGAVASGIWGVLVERISERKLVIFTMTMSGCSAAFLLTVQSPVHAYAFAMAFGLFSRGETSLIMMLVAQYFGRESYGRISGLMSPFQMLGLGSGPLIAAISFDQTGSYETAFTLFVVSFFFAAFLLLLARKPVMTSTADVHKGS